MKRNEALEILAKVKDAIDTAQNHQLDASTELEFLDDEDGIFDEIKERVDDLSGLISDLLDLIEQVEDEIAELEEDDED